VDRLSSFDASFLANERGNAHMAIGALLVFHGSPPSHEDFLVHIRARLHRLPRLRQRLLFPPLRLGTPFWIDHRQFDIRRHVRRIALPAPGSENQLQALVGELVAPPLDRSKPLWELTVLTGLSDERFAIVYRTHHAMADGISAVDIGMLLFDLEPREEPDRDEVPWSPARPPSRPALAGRGLIGIAAMVPRLRVWLAGAIEHPRRTSRRATDGLAGLWEVTWNLVRPAPKVPFNAEIGRVRAFRSQAFDLAEVKQVKDTVGGTVNDVILAVVAGALRRWLAAQGVDVGGLELMALVPVSIRAEDEHGELGNRLTAMRGPLPIGIADPLARLRAISAALDALKSSKQPLGAEAI
jgi:diacylglycerol O-acyltransferase